MTTTQNIVELLGPGPGTERVLGAFTDGFQKAKHAFDQLLQYPHLEAMKYTNNEDETSKKSKAGGKQNLREFLIEGQNCFRISTERDRQAATNLMAYGEFVEPFLDGETLAR